MLSDLFYKATVRVMTWMSLSPILALAVTFAFRRYDFHAGRFAVAAALALSWVPDMVNRILTLSGYSLGDTITQIFAPIQFAIILCVVVSGSVGIPLALGSVVLIATVSALQGAPTYDLVVPVVVGAAIAYCAYREGSDFHRGLIVYFGVGAVPFAAFALTAHAETWMSLSSWYIYQGTRLVGLLLITAAIVQQDREPQLRLV